MGVYGHKCVTLLYYIILYSDIYIDARINFPEHKYGE
jgi:hypothetical protein